MPEQLICDLCGEETHGDTSEMFTVLTNNGTRTERHCFDCDPPDEDYNDHGCGKWGCRECYPGEDD